MALLVVHVMCLVIGFLSPTHALKIAFGSGEVAVFPHATARFGPRSFNISAPGAVPNATKGCSLDDVPQFAPGKVALIRRGDCFFVQKAQYAARGGAVAVVVGNHKGLQHIISMVAASGFPVPDIPAVFVGGHTFDFIVNVTSTIGGVITVDSTSGVAPLSPLPDPSGGGSDIAESSWYLFLLPGLWCFLATVYYIKRWCLFTWAKRERAIRTRRIPCITFRCQFNVVLLFIARISVCVCVCDCVCMCVVYSRALLQEEAQEAQANQEIVSPGEDPEEDRNFLTARQRQPQDLFIHNESCAICLDDFEDGAEVKLLFCHHGYHRECIDRWLLDRSDECPICKRSILDGSPSICVRLLTLFNCSLCAGWVCCRASAGSQTPRRSSSFSAATVPLEEVHVESDDTPS